MERKHKIEFHTKVIFLELTCFQFPDVVLKFSL